MKTYSTALTAEKAKAAVTTLWGLVITYHSGAIGRYIDSQEATRNISGNTFDRTAFELSGFVASDGSPSDGGTIKFGNVDLAFGAIALNDEFKNALVRVYELWFDSSDTLIGTDLIFSGRVVGRPSLDESWVTVAVAAHRIPWTNRFPRTRITKEVFTFIPIRGTRFAWGNQIMEVK